MAYYEHVLTRILGPNFKCTWKASFSGNPKTIWQYHTNGHNVRTGKDTVVIWSPKKAQKGPASTSGGVGSDALPNVVIDGSAFWPYTNWANVSVNLQLGLDGVGHSVAWWRSVQPEPPVIELTPSDSNRTQTWEIDSDPSKVRLKNNNYWTHCRYWAQVAQYGERWADVPDWATGGWTEQFEPTDDQTGRTWTHTAADPAPAVPYAVRVVARNEGPAGESAVAYGAEHIFARPRTPSLATSTNAGNVTISVEPNADWWHPIDHVVVERQVSATLDPSGTWTKIYDEDESTGTLRSLVDADGDRLDGLATDKATWYRCRVWHDYDANSAQAYASTAALCGQPKAPTITASFQDATNTITADIDVESEMLVETWVRVMAGTDVVVDWFKWTPQSDSAETIRDADGNAIEFDPTLTYRVHAQNRTVSGTSSGVTVDYGGERRSVEAASAQVSSASQAEVVGASLSAVVIDSATLNADGAGVTIAYHWGTDDLGNVTITAKGTSIEWTDASGGWLSTDQPSTHRVDDGAGKSGVVSVDGLKEGTLYHIRLRRYVTVDGTDGYGPEAEIEVVPQSTPSKPVLSAPGAVRAGSGVAYSWTFADEGDSAQTQAQLMIGGLVHQIEGSRGAYAYQTADADAGTTLSAQVRVSTGGGWSEWSDAVSTTVAAPPTCTAALAGSVATSSSSTQAFSGDGETATFEVACEVTSVTSVQVDGVDVAYSRSGNAFSLASAPADGASVEISYAHPISAYGNAMLTALPLSLSLGGTGDAWRVSVTCAKAATLATPGGSEAHVVGDAIAYAELHGSGVVDCQPIEGGGYDVEVVCVDTSTGLESEPVTLMFQAGWATPAVEPTATVELSDGVATITPSQGQDAADETCRIWRVTADGAVLCADDATWDVGYEDAVPPFGDGAAYVVESVTADGSHAWASVPYSLAGRNLVVRWGGSEVELPWNLELSSKYETTFERRAHLDGSRSGYFQAGCDRDFTASGALERDAPELSALRELGRFAGICFVRAPGLVAMAAHCDVAIGRGYKSGTADVDLSFSEVDDDGTWQLSTSAEDDDGSWS